jgi:hypothetical protein
MGGASALSKLTMYSLIPLLLLPPSPAITRRVSLPSIPPTIALCGYNLCINCRSSVCSFFYLHCNRNLALLMVRFLNVEVEIDAVAWLPSSSENPDRSGKRATDRIEPVKGERINNLRNILTTKKFAKALWAVVIWAVHRGNGIIPFTSNYRACKTQQIRLRPNTKASAGADKQTSKQAKHNFSPMSSISILHPRPSTRSSYSFSCVCPGAAAQLPTAPPSLRRATEKWSGWVGANENRGEQQKGRRWPDPYVPAPAGRAAPRDRSRAGHHGAASLLLAHGSP